eukprot:3194174-Rhodomonas_salina.1
MDPRTALLLRALAFLFPTHPLDSSTLARCAGERARARRGRSPCLGPRGTQMIRPREPETTHRQHKQQGHLRVGGLGLGCEGPSLGCVEGVVFRAALRVQGVGVSARGVGLMA